MRKALVLAAAVVLTSVGTAQASAILSDSFSYADNAALAAKWTGAATVVPGLTFGSLTTSGGAISLNNSDASSAAVAVTGAQLWTSFLVRQDTPPESNEWGDANVVKSYFTDSAGANGKFAYIPLSKKQYQSSVNYVSLGATDGGAGSPQLLLNVGTTYLVIGSVEVNGALWTTHYDKMWLFDQAAFANFLTAGGTEGQLDANTLSKAITDDGSWGTNTVNAGDLLHLSSTVGTATFDEYRSGTSLGDVIVVPEPASLGLIGAASVALLRRRKRC